MTAQTHHQAAPSMIAGATRDRTTQANKTLPTASLIFCLFAGAGCVYLATQASVLSATLGLYTGGIVALLLALLLAMRKAWARPAAVIFHLWTAIFALLAAWQLVAGAGVTVGGLTVPTAQVGLTGVAVVSLLLGFLLQSARGVAAFATGETVRDMAPICTTCGATLAADASCAYCDGAGAELYFLQPVLKNARRIPLAFEPGHERIRIGRSVGNGEAWIDSNANKRYRTISRHHADIELNSATGDLTLYKAFTNQDVLVNNQSVVMSASVKLGSLIQLGKVQFVLGNSEYEPTLAYFVDQADENRRYLLRFNGLDNEQTIGRGPQNNIVLSDKRDISTQHAAILFDHDSQQFFVRNASQKRPIYIDGHVLEPGRTTTLSPEELTIVQLGAHNFNFLPVPYQPNLQERGHA